MYCMKAYYYTNLIKDGRTIQGYVLIKEGALNEVVWYPAAAGQNSFFMPFFLSFLNSLKFIMLF